MVDGGGNGDDGGDGGGGCQYVNSSAGRAEQGSRLTNPP